jgi:hypothetical protein
VAGAVLFSTPKAHPTTASRPVLVELFTSEGCSSCPPADGLLAELDRKQPVAGANIIVLSEHVDYWNSLGWRDPYSSSRWSERQSEYGRRFGLDSVYTPQMVVDGTRQAVGSDSHAVRRAIEQSAGETSVPIEIADVAWQSGVVQVRFAAAAAPHATLYAVLADESDRSSVERGENAGRTLNHVAVARGLVRVGDLRSAAADKTVAVNFPQADTNRHHRVILFAQDDQNGRIAGVAERDLR